jgi:hypothetical protein
MKLDKAFLKEVAGPIGDCWQQIYPDAEVSNSEEAIELVLDANRMTTLLGKEGEQADAVIGRAIDEHGYEKVLSFLAREIPL